MFEDGILLEDYAGLKSYLVPGRSLFEVLFQLFWDCNPDCNPDCRPPQFFSVLVEGFYIPTKKNRN